MSVCGFSQYVLSALNPFLHPGLLQLPALNPKPLNLQPRSSKQINPKLLNPEALNPWTSSNPLHNTQKPVFRVLEFRARCASFSAAFRIILFDLGPRRLRSCINFTVEGKFRVVDYMLSSSYFGIVELGGGRFGGRACKDQSL